MSLRLRLLVAVGLISLVALVVADFATYSALRSSLYKQDDQSLAQTTPHLHIAVDQVTGQVVCQHPVSGGLGPPGGASGDSGSGAASNAFAFLFYEVRTPKGKLVDGLTCPAYVGTHAYRPQLPSVVTGFTTQSDGPQAAFFTAASVKSGGPAFRVEATQITNPDFAGDQLVVAEPIGDTTNTLHTLLLIELAVTAGALVLALAGGWWLVRLGLRPLEDVERTAESIAAGNLDQRVPGADDTTEVGRLARALNVMLERIQAAFTARVASEARLQESDRHLRQFVADASHELRTPIAAVSAYAELFERGAGQHAEDLPRVFRGIRSETARMERLVNDLLVLARYDEGVPVQIVPTELVGLVADAVHTAGTVGPQWPVHFAATRPVEVMGDPTRLRQVVDNLLANVRAHTPEGTTAAVRVEQEGATAEIVVKDTGPGMPSEDAARVFERFYRADASRVRGQGGSGLGLSIVAAIVAAHGGTVSATSSPGEGMAVTVRIPVIALTVEPAATNGAVGADADGMPPAEGAAATAEPAATADTAATAETAETA